MTAAQRALRAHHVVFSEYEYRYELHGGTRASSQALGVDEHAVVKTLVMEDDTRTGGRGAVGSRYKTASSPLSAMTFRSVRAGPAGR